MNPILRAALSRLLGDRGERAAAKFLRRKKMRVLVRGYRTGRGEVDLIVRDGQTLVFVEVKTRRRGEPVEAVTPEKQRRLTQAALHFAKRYGVLDQKGRFDVVGVIWPEGGRTPEIKHYPNAFDAADRGPMFR